MGKIKEPIYPNLSAEMGRQRLSCSAVAKRSSIGYGSFLNKFNGRTDFIRREMLSIRDNNFPGMTLEYLFAKTL